MGPEFQGLASQIEQAAGAKMREFRLHGDGAGYDFVPLATESFGRLGKAAARFLSDLGEVAARDGRASKGAFVRSALATVSCALCRGNARVYRHAMCAVACAVGRQFLPGCDVPVDEVLEE